MRIWSTHVKDGVIQVPPTTLTLITTAEAPAASIAAALRPGRERDCAAALDRLREVAQTSKNDDLKAAFAAFSALTDDQQFRLVEAIHVLDNSPDISDTGDKIRDRIRAAVDRQNRDALFERLEGWWFGKVVDQLRSAKPAPVAGFEVYDKLRAIAEQFGPDALPIDYLDARPDSVDPHTDNRTFVRQLRAIDVGLTRIEKAILDYYRAFEQRSRWAREELLVGDEVDSYERRLIDEWERFAAALTEELDGAASEIELKRVGRQIFNWMEQTADLRIRPNVSELYVMRGSFHILANKPAPSVWWHPKFVERLSEIHEALERPATGNCAPIQPGFLRAADSRRRSGIRRSQPWWYAVSPRVSPAPDHATQSDQRIASWEDHHQDAPVDSRASGSPRRLCRTLRCRGRLHS